MQKDECKEQQRGAVTVDILDDEINRYLETQADQYVSLPAFLKQHHLTLSEARKRVRAFWENYCKLLSRYHIRYQPLAETCEDLLAQIYQHPENPELQHLYFCVVTDNGLLQSGRETFDEKQNVRKGIQQEACVQELTEFLRQQQACAEKLHDLRAYLKKPVQPKLLDCSEEADWLYRLTIQHTFLYGSVGNSVYRKNLYALLACLNGNVQLKAVKPYLLFAVLARKTGMMQTRAYFMPNFKAVLQYQEYNILHDNGKNFNQYQSNLELYYHLRQSYLDGEGVDMALCDYCFAALSPLSEWYYLNCRPDWVIPMTLERKIQFLMPDTFPMLLSYEAYNELGEEELEQYNQQELLLWERMLDAASLFLPK